MEFTLLKDSDLKKAYSIITWGVEHLLSRNIRQYLKPYPPIEIFRERQTNRYNYALYDGNDLAAIVTLIPNHKDDDWKEFINSDNYIWISTLFTSKDHKGKNLGTRVLKEIEYLLQKSDVNTIYLDCYLGDGFLLNFYQNNGYHEISRKLFKYPNREFEAVLMKKVMHHQ